jgi:4-hydroxybenzoate polyprenyltransferase
VETGTVRRATATGLCYALARMKTLEVSTETRRWRVYWRLARPFTLLAPALGMLSGGVTALGARPPSRFTPSVALDMALGTLMAAVLNAASNGLNQIHDREIDRVNKPGRPIPSGRLTVGEAYRFTVAAYVVALALAWAVNIQCFILAAIAAFFTWVYSAPPFRTKRNAILANVTIAIPRGVMLKVAGWSMVKTVIGREPWYIGLIFGSFLLGATTTKDFADIKGDNLGGCRTLPVRYGVRKSAYAIAPFFVLPFLLLPLGAATGILTGNHTLLTVLGFGLACWGAYVAYLVVRRPEELASTENHISWTHMYLMMMAMQIGFMVAYLVR